MSTNFTDRSKEVSSAFSRVLPLIERALLSNYRLPPEEAAEVEHRLYEWFQRFCRRPGSSRPPQSLRSELLLMACRAGHVCSVSKTEESWNADERLRRSLTLGPEVIAIEIEKGLGSKEREDEP